MTTNPDETPMSRFIAAAEAVAQDLKARGCGPDAADLISCTCLKLLGVMDEAGINIGHRLIVLTGFPESEGESDSYKQEVRTMFEAAGRACEGVVNAFLRVNSGRYIPGSGPSNFHPSMFKITDIAEGLRELGISVVTPTKETQT